MVQMRTWKFASEIYWPSGGPLGLRGLRGWGLADPGGPAGLDGPGGPWGPGSLEGPGVLEGLVCKGGNECFGRG